ncbi:MAG: hypothetical protein U0931_04720 [Vulcanimicrobiota bacterium]
MLNAQIRRNLQQNQITEPRGLTVRPQVFFTEDELATPNHEAHDVFVPRDPCQDQPLMPDLRVSQA